MRERFWESGDQARRTEELARRYPRRDGEGPGAYTRRLAQLAGLEPAEPGADLTTGERLTVASVRLPYREPGEEG